MKKAAIEIEDIEEKRRQEGIEDVDLRKKIRELRVGDVVKVTLIASPGSFETLPVRITRITGRDFRGKLARGPVCKGLAQISAGKSLTFSAVHIHSIAREP